MSLKTNVLAKTTKTPFSVDVGRADGVFIYDKQGKKYFDLISGIAVSNLGHQNPRVVEAIKNQVDKYLHVMVFGEYYQSPQVKLAEKINEIL